MSSNDAETKAIHGIVEGGFFIIPNKLITLGAWATMSGSEIKVYGTLGKHADNNTGHSWPSIKTIASESGVTRGTASLAIQGLEYRGLIKVKRTKNPASGLNEVNEYWIIRPDQWDSAKIVLVRKSSKRSTKNDPKLDSSELDSDSSAKPPRSKKSSKGDPFQENVGFVLYQTSRTETGTYTQNGTPLDKETVSAMFIHVKGYIKQWKAAGYDFDEFREFYKLYRAEYPDTKFGKSGKSAAMEYLSLKGKQSTTSQPALQVAVDYIKRPTDDIEVH